jgi:transcriptional regulator with XRE-family HTH domain
MDDEPVLLNQRIAERVRELRGEQNCSLQELAERSGVSRSMISLIERAESSPTAVVLEKLAAGLNVTLASFFERPVLSSQRHDHPVSRLNEQPEWRDPESGYRRRNVSPAGVPQPLKISEVHFPPGARVAFENGLRDRPVYQQVWILKGVMDITAGTERHRLFEGDCLAMQLDAPTMFHNPTEETARYAVVIATGLRRRQP